MVVKPINSYQEFKDIIEQDKLVVLCFWAEWSAPCRLISPLFELHSDIHKGADFYKVDADAQEEISQEVGINAMPTVWFFKDGLKVDEVVSATPPALDRAIMEHLE